MKKSRTRNGGAVKSGAHALIFGIILTVAVFFGNVLIGAIIAKGTENPTGNIGMIALCAFFITAAVSGFAVSRYKGEGGFMPAVLTALLFVLVLLIIGLVIARGKLPLMTVINFGVYVLISAVFAVFGKKREHRRRSR